MLTRRRFLIVGTLGATALGLAGWWAVSRRSDGGAGAAPEHVAIVRAIVPAMLAGALPDDPVQQRAALDATVDGVARAIAGLPPYAQHELGELFALLALAPARLALAGVAPRWEDASVAEVDAFLTRWRDSGWALKRSAYRALHQLIFAAWYGNAASWPAIGYGGPPRLDPASDTVPPQR